MVMTEKYYTLPSSTSFCYSTIYHSPTRDRIREIKTRLDFQSKPSTLYEPDNMKLLLEQQPTIRTYSLYDVQERIDYFEKKKFFDDLENNTKEKVHSNPSSSSSAETLQSVIANTLQQTFFNNESYGSALSRTMMNSAINGKRRSLSSSHLASSNDEKRSNRYCSSLSKRIRTYSLSNHSTMAITAITSFSEEQTTSIDYENTYFYPEETTRIDDALSLTTITSNIPAKITNTQRDNSSCSDTAVFQSDTDENSEGIPSAVKQYRNTCDINMTCDLQNKNNKNNDEEIIRIRLSLTPPDHDFTGIVHATKYTIVKEKECLFDYDNANHYSQQDIKIRSNVDNVSLNKSMTLSILQDQCRRISTDEQLNQQAAGHSIKMNNDIELVTQQENDDDDDGHYSDESRYSSDAARNSCASDDLNNTSSTLRQEAISITRVRCKRRKTWIRSPSSPTRISNNNTKPTSYLQQRRLKTNLIQPFSLDKQGDGTDARQYESMNSTTVLNQTRVKTSTTAMLLHNNSINYHHNQNKNDEIHSYNFLPLNDDHHLIKTDDTPLSKTSSTLDKDSSPPATDEKADDLYTSSLNTVKRLLNESIDSNIEIIQMDEQECILEIVDGVLTIVPKDKSTSSSINSDGEKNRKKQKHIKHKPSKHQTQRSTSIASSISTPSLSEQEQERDESSSTSSSRLISKPFVFSHDIPIIKPSIQTQQSADVLDLFSSPIKPTPKTLLDDSLSSVSSYGDHSFETKKQQSSILRSSSPIHAKLKPSSIKDTSPSSIENQTRSNKNTVLSELLKTVKKSSPASEKPTDDYPILKSEPTPVPKPINKNRISEFASLLSASVHLTQPPSINSNPKPTRSDDQSSSSVPDRETYQIIKPNNSDQEQTKKHIDARYNERLDDRGSIKINTANIKALFEQKISDTNKALSQSNEHLLHLTEVRQQHKKVPVSYGSLKRNLPNYQQQILPNNNTKRRSYIDPGTMNKYTDHIVGAKDVVIEDKPVEFRLCF